MAQGPQTSIALAAPRPQHLTDVEDRLLSILQAAGAAVTRVTNVGDRFLGSISTGAKEEDKVAPLCVLSRLEAVISAIQRQQNLLFAEIERIETL